MEHSMQLANNHISVDCSDWIRWPKFKVLLVRRIGEDESEVFHDMKLPEVVIIYMDEDLDSAAQRVLATDWIEKCRLKAI